MSQIPSGDEQLLRQRLAQAAPGEVISDETARALAKWFARAIGPGFGVFLVNGLVTRELYRELTYLYDHRRPEAEAWLDALVRYSLWQPLTGVGEADNEEHRE